MEAPPRVSYRTSDFRFCMNASSLLTWVTCFSHWRSHDLYLGTFKDSCEIHTISTFSFGLWEKGLQLTNSTLPFKATGLGSIVRFRSCEVAWFFEHIFHKSLVFFSLFLAFVYLGYFIWKKYNLEFILVFMKITYNFY